MLNGYKFRHPDFAVCCRCVAADIARGATLKPAGDEKKLGENLVSTALSQNASNNSAHSSEMHLELLGNLLVGIAARRIST